MKARISLSSEIDIDLSIDELSRLEQETLKGAANVRELPKECNPLREIELCIRELQSGLIVEMKTFPKNACFEEIRKYIIIVSQDGYEMLKSKGRTCGRIGIGLCKVNIYARGNGSDF